MRKTTKILLITAGSLVLIGLIMFVAVMTAYHWDFTNLSTEKYETNTYEINEEFSSIKMAADTADILFVASSDDTCTVVCYEQENMKHSVCVKNGTLTVDAADDTKWHDYIGVGLHSPKVTVYLPKTEYASLAINESTGSVEIPKEFLFENADISLSTGDVKFFASVSDSIRIDTSTGDIRIENISADTLCLSVSTGMVTVSDVTCKNVLSSGSTGDISLTNVNTAEKITIERSTGDVVFDRSDAAEIFVKTDTGDVTGSLLSEKVFIAESSTGSISVPETTSGGKCEIITSTGDIEIGIDS